MRNLWIILFFTFFISGCSTSIPINYVPSPMIKGDGDLFVGDTVYTPSLQGKVKDNETQKATGAIGNIYTTTPISEIVKKSFQKELISAGFSINDLSETVIDITVDKFLYDWVGVVEVDFYIDLTFVVKKRGEKIMKYSVKSHQAAPKTMHMDSEAIKAALSSAFSEFLLEARSRKVL